MGSLVLTCFGLKSFGFFARFSGVFSVECAGQGLPWKQFWGCWLRGRELWRLCHRWAELWAKADVAVQGDRLTQTMARLHTYHLLAAASPNSAPLDVGLPYSGSPLRLVPLKVTLGSCHFEW